MGKSDAVIARLTACGLVSEQSQRPRQTTPGPLRRRFIASPARGVSILLVRLVVPTLCELQTVYENLCWLAWARRCCRVARWVAPFVSIIELVFRVPL